MYTNSKERCEKMSLCLQGSFFLKKDVKTQVLLSLLLIHYHGTATNGFWLGSVGYCQLSKIKMNTQVKATHPLLISMHQSFLKMDG